MAQSNEDGTLTGTVYDSVSGKPLPDAKVDALEPARAVAVDKQGAFRLVLPAGTRKLRISAPNHESRTITVDVLERQTSSASVALKSAGTVLEIVDVFAQLARGTETAQVEERKQAATASENISAEAIQQSPDSDAGEIVQRLSGITVKHDKFIFVRGLGERYSSALLNQSRLPSTNPDKRVISLDFFPANFIESLSITKSYTPDLPGDFSGGLVDIRLREPAEDLTYGIGISTGGNTETLFQDFETYKGSDTDYFGFGAKYRELPEIFGDAILEPPTADTTARQRKLHSSFRNIWDTDTTTAPPNLGMNVHIGDSFGPFGFNFGAVYGNAYNVRRGEIARTFFTEEGVDEFKEGSRQYQGTNFSYDRSRLETQLGGLLTASYRLSDKHKLALRSFVNRNSSDEVLDGSGHNDNREGFETFSTRLLYREEQLGFGQVSSEHDFDVVRFDWRTAVSETRRDDPDTRFIRRSRPLEMPGSTPLIDFASPSLLRTFVDLRETMTDTALDMTVPFRTALPFTSIWRGLDAKVKAGIAYTLRDRKMEFRRFGYTQQGVTNDLLALPVEELLAPENIGTTSDGAPLEFSERTQPADNFAATHEIAGTYGMLELPLIENRLRAVGGVRLEYSYIRTGGFDRSSRPLSSIINDLDPIPGFNLIYAPRDDMNLRYGFSRTVSRPELRELTPTEFPVPDGERAIEGNPDLVSSSIDSHDLRWEWFLTEIELLSLSVFYKDISDAIEQVAEGRNSSVVDSFVNTDGTLWGLELEARKNLGFLSSWLPQRPWLQAAGYQLGNLTFLINASYIDSQVDVPKLSDDIVCPPPGSPDRPDECGRNHTNTSRALQGQSPFSINASLEYAPEDWGRFRVLYGTVGRRIVSAGVDGLPDIYEERRDQLDFVWTGLINPFGVPLDAKVSIENLLNDEHQQTQAGIDTSLYQVGVRFGLGLSYKF
ncbi:MAG TPA: TonB-dependent receptor [Terriglobales bacterium]|nr:TonB-dependent receptor [Terriglobales bacterium]